MKSHLLMFQLPGFCCKSSYISWLLPYLFGAIPQSYVSVLGLSPQKVCLTKHNSQLTFRLWFFFFQLTEAFLIFSSALGILLWKILRGINLRVEDRLPAWYPKLWIRQSQYSSSNFFPLPLWVKSDHQPAIHPLTGCHIILCTSLNQLSSQDSCFFFTCCCCR